MAKFKLILLEDGTVAELNHWYILLEVVALNAVLHIDAFFKPVNLTHIKLKVIYILGRNEIAKLQQFCTIKNILSFFEVHNLLLHTVDSLTHLLKLLNLGQG